MKIKAKQYAQALYEMTFTKKEKQLDLYIKNFVKILAKNGDLKHALEILKHFTNIYNQQNNTIEIKVTTKTKLPEEVKDKLINELKKLENFKDYKNFELIEKTNKDLIGGIKLEFEDQVIDASLKARISQLKTSMIK